MDWCMASLAFGGALIKPEAEEDAQHLGHAKCHLSSPHSVLPFNRKTMNGCVGQNAFIWSPRLCMTPYFVSAPKHLSVRQGKSISLAGRGDVLMS